MRTGYAGAKMLAFCGLALIQAFEGSGAAGPPWLATLVPVVNALVLVAVALCLVRGVPVILGGLGRSGRASEGLRGS